MLPGLRKEEGLSLSNRDLTPWAERGYDSLPDLRGAGTPVSESVSPAGDDDAAAYEGGCRSDVTVIRSCYVRHMQSHHWPPEVDLLLTI